MTKEEIIKEMDHLHDVLIRTQGEEQALEKTIASMNCQINSIHRRRKAIHEQIEGLKYKIIKMDLSMQ